MKKVIVLLTLLFLVGVSVHQTKAVVSEEFGGGKIKQVVSPKLIPEGVGIKVQGEARFSPVDRSATATVNREEVRNRGEEERIREENRFFASSTSIVIEDGQTVEVRGWNGFEVQGTRLRVMSSTTGSTTEYRLKSALPSLVNQLTRTWRENGASTTVQGLEIKIEEGEPVYEVTFTEGAKLFGFIPLKLTRTAIVSSETEEIKDVKQPWYSFLVRKLNLFNRQLENEGVATSTEQVATTTATTTDSATTTVE